MSTWTTKLRAPVLGVSIAVAAILAGPLHATQMDTNTETVEIKGKASKQENIGVATGLAVGAAAGGPVGAIIGAAAGAWLGDRYHKQAVTNQKLSANLDQTESERLRLTQAVAEMNGTLADSNAKNDMMIRALDRTKNLETEVSFRTGDAQVSAAAAGKLQKLGQLVGTMPGVKLHISGYADPRGSSEFNAALSQRRAEAVASALAEGGVAPDQLIVEALGESSSTTADGDIDGYALERKVVVRFEQTEVGQVARNQ